MTSVVVSDQDWQQILAQAERSGRSLLTTLQLDQHTELVQQLDDDSDFPVLVPAPFIARMRPGDPEDPLLRQVLAVQQERLAEPDYVTDPLAEQQSNVQPGIVHKYHGRVLLIATGGCAVNCRYCFRRHFPYAENRLGRKDWQQALDYVRADNSIREVILSGGDPLLLSDDSLQQLITQIESIGHVRRLRLHSRVPVVIPQRLTPGLQALLSATSLQVSLVLHVNHPAELGPLHGPALDALRKNGITLLNQTVLLRGVNDDAAVLCELSETLFALGVLPYYLHRLDKVQGAQHFAVEEARIFSLYQAMQTRLPGYLLPRLVCEEAGKASKTLLLP